MVFWSRSRLLRIGSLANQHYHLSSITSQQHIQFTNTRVLDRNPSSAQPYGFVRFFAAPVLANSAKPKPKEDTGLRLNEKITAEFVRLVEDDRHGVVSRREALDRARKLKLDLVEVDRASKPPVCKIMDYHKEKYKRQLTEKEKIKTKAEAVLRKGSPKEIRFTDKTEKKDLQTKADTVKRLMEKGYRVKCMAVGNKEGQDLGGMLSRLSALIEDVAIVESGPMVEKKQAYVIVRHMKFGLTKKGAGKKTSTSSTSSAASPSSKPNQGPQEIEETLDEPDTQSESEDNVDPGEMETPFTSSAERQDGGTGGMKTTWSTLKENEDFEKIFSFDENKGAASSSGKLVDEKDGIFPLEDVVGYTNSEGLSFAQVNRGQGATNTVSQGPAQVDNRYSRQGATNTVPQGPAGSDNRYSGRSATYTAPQGPAQAGDNRYAGRSATNPVLQRPAQVGDSKYSGRGPANTIPQGHGQVGDNRYSVRGPANAVPQGHGQVGDNRYSGRGPANTVPQGHGQVGDNRYSGRGPANTVPQGHGQVGDNRYSGRGPANTVPQGHGQVGDNRYSGRGPANTVPQGHGQVGENRYSGRGPANTVPQGHGQVGENRYSGRSAANVMPQGPAEVRDNRYSGQSDVRGKFLRTTEGLADVTKSPEFPPDRFGQAKWDPAAINRVPNVHTQVGENRYGAPQEVKIASQPTPSEFSPVRAPQFNIGSAATNTPNQGSRTPVVPTFGNFLQQPTDEPLKREPLHPTATETPRPSFGIFSASKTQSPAGQTVSTEASKVRGSTSPDPSTELEDDEVEARKWGQFGR